MNTTHATRGKEHRREPLDCTVRLVTPERIVFAHPLAGPSRRFAAYLVDQIIVIACAAVIFMISIFVSLGSMAALGPFFVAYFVLTWGYGAFFESIFNGQTLGKGAAGIRVISEQGVPITGAQAVIRNLISTVDGLLPFFYLTALASMFLSRKFQRLGDLAAGTIVIVEERRLQRAVTKVDDPEVVSLLDWLPTRITARPAVTRVLSDYVEVRERFGPLRRGEMAGPLARPLRRQYALPEKFSDDAVLCAVYYQMFVSQ